MFFLLALFISLESLMLVVSAICFIVILFFYIFHVLSKTNNLKNNHLDGKKKKHFRQTRCFGMFKTIVTKRRRHQIRIENIVAKYHTKGQDKQKGIYRIINGDQSCSKSVWMLYSTYDIWHRLCWCWLPCNLQNIEGNHMSPRSVWKHYSTYDIVVLLLYLLLMNSSKLIILQSTK